MLSSQPARYCVNGIAPSSVDPGKLTPCPAELKGNQQADDIKAGIGSLGGLKKNL